MSTMIPFLHTEFHEVPRCIVLNQRDIWLLLKCDFDESLNRYADHYAVYQLPSSVERELDRGEWGFVHETGLKWVGTIKVQDVTFDATKRAKLRSQHLQMMTAILKPLDGNRLS